ncbi:MAG: hypothetical protein ABIS69_02555 [Sediminibacterium sp.]
MELKMYEIDGTQIDYSKSSIEIFPAIAGLKNATGLYLKFSKNHIKSLAIEHHASLLLDFDLCLIDRVTNETIIQLFAIFTLTKNREPVNDWKYVLQAVEFARSMIITVIKEAGLQDQAGDEIRVPEFTLTPESINFCF